MYSQKSRDNFSCFYLVGFILFILPFTRGIFISITSLSLLFVFAIVFYQHRNWDYKTVSWFLFIFFSSFFLEMIGISTGRIFGEYAYGRALGWKINGTPIIIGLNWLFLVYASHDIMERKTANPLLRILGGALLMICYDLIVELVAPFMQMWEFQNRYPPISNYISWFIAAIVYHTGFEVLHIHSDNSYARILFWIQLIFFMGIGIYSFIFLI